MNSSNPFSMMMNMMNGGGMNKRMPGIGNMGNMGSNPMAQMMQMIQGRNNQSSSNNIPLNQNQFKQFLPNIDDNILQQLVQQAKNQGMSDSDIQAGLNFIKQLK